MISTVVKATPADVFSLSKRRRTVVDIERRERERVEPPTNYAVVVALLRKKIKS